MDNHTLRSETLSSLSHATAVIGAWTQDQEALVATLAVSPHDTVILNARTNGGIKDIREFTNHLYMSPQYGSVRLGIIYAAEKLTHEAQNALLKLLEEPPERVKILLFINAEGGVLPTVLSRCRRYWIATAPTKTLVSPEKGDSLTRFLDSEELAKQDISSLAYDWLAASYQEWCRRGRPVDGIKDVARYWHFYRSLEAQINKRLILEQLVLSSL